MSVHNFYAPTLTNFHQFNRCNDWRFFKTDCRLLKQGCPNISGYFLPGFLRCLTALLSLEVFTSLLNHKIIHLLVWGHKNTGMLIFLFFSPILKSFDFDRILKWLTIICLRIKQNPKLKVVAKSGQVLRVAVLQSRKTVTWWHDWCLLSVLLSVRSVITLRLIMRYIYHSHLIRLMRSDHFQWGNMFRD